MSSQPETAEKHFVEEVGLAFEQTGMPRMAGRILGWLMIANPAHQTTDELRQALLASRAQSAR